MTINAFEFSKALLISILYNMIILTSIKCNDSYIEQFISDYDTNLIVNKSISITENYNLYIDYHFNNTLYPGQLKINPVGFFSSIYNCTYIVLPELDHGFYDYLKYSESMNTLKYEKKREELLAKLNPSLLKKESKFVNDFKDAYEASKNAYKALEKFEEYANTNGNTIDYETEKNKAIKDYTQILIPRVTKLHLKYSEYWGGNMSKYVFENYEAYTEPTKDIYYMPNIIMAEHDAIIERTKTGVCNSLTEIQYIEIIFLYNLLPDQNDPDNDFKYIIESLKILYRRFHEMISTTAKLKKRRFHEMISTTAKLKKRNCFGMFSTTAKLKKKKNQGDNEFVVNNENYMSYLIRLKKQGSVGFHQSYHTSMYKIKSKDYFPTDYTIVMDIFTENFVQRNDKLDQMSKISS